MTTRALLVIDVQNDFCEGGSLPVSGGAAVAAAISAHIHDHAGDYAAIVATKDWHHDPGAHFAAEPDYVDSWPVHCAAGTLGAESHPDLDTTAIQAWFHKGETAAAYSGFEGALAEDAQAGESRAEAPGSERERLVARPPAGLARWLRERKITAVDVVGIATDHCVRATALDAVREGFDTRVLLDLTAGVAQSTTERALAEMAAAGVELAGAPRVGA